MSSRPILGLLYTMQSLERLGEDPGPVLARHGLDLRQMAPDARIDRALELRINAELAEQLHDPLAGLKTGTAFGFTSYGPFAMLLLSCADAHEAFTLGVRYQRLTYLFSTLGYEPGPKKSALCLAPLPLSPRAFRFRIDAEMAGTFKLMTDIQNAVGADFRPAQVDMPYARPTEAARYEEHFGCPVRWDEAQGRFWIRNEHLHLRFRTADPAAHAMYRQMCDRQLVDEEKEIDDLSHQVLQHLELLDHRAQGAAYVARFFGLSERSLRRRLADEGRSFRALVACARYRQAVQLLAHTRLSVEQIAERLGYAESAAFVHAFQRWAGTSPARFRATRTITDETASRSGWVRPDAAPDDCPLGLDIPCPAPCTGTGRQRRKPGTARP